MGNLGKTLTFTFVLVFLLSLVILQPITVKAQTKTIIVPDDYLTIQAAINHANAGDTVFVKKGTYYCSFENGIHINKSLSLIGEDANTTIINGQLEPHIPRLGGLADWSIVLIDASSVLITGFTITNGENAIGINKYSNSFKVSGIRIIGNNLVENIVGISDVGNYLDNNLIVSGNYIINNSVIGFNLYSSNSDVSNNIFSGNKQALNLNEADRTNIRYNYITNNTIGVALEGVSHTHIFGNNITGYLGSPLIKDYGYGIEFDLNCNNTLVYDNNIFGNTRGIYLQNGLLMSDSWNAPISQGSGNMIFHNNFFNNSENANVEHKYPNKVAGLVNGTAIVSWDSGVVGNYWDDYNGNSSYVIDENNIDHNPLTQQVVVTTSPTPFVPELSWLVILPFLLSVFSVAVIVRHRKTFDQ
jgi:nitrous oxidase accessory protein NosD